MSKRLNDVLSRYERVEDRTDANHVAVRYQLRNTAENPEADDTKLNRRQFSFHAVWVALIGFFQFR